MEHSELKQSRETPRLKELIGHAGSLLDQIFFITVQQHQVSNFCSGVKMLGEASIKN